MELQNLLEIFRSNGCQKVYIKSLSPNDNSKNQVYIAGNFEILNILPLSNIETEPAGDWKLERFKANLPFSWIMEDGALSEAPHSKLILYPGYPEVRFSGFLLKSPGAPSELMTQRLDGRLLFLAVTSMNRVIGFVTSPDSSLAKEFENIKVQETFGVFSVLELTDSNANRRKLIVELKRIHESGWIESKRLDKNGNILPCLSSNCGGYTLEAELGITPNGYSEPDFLGWELKQFKVKDFNRLNSAVITLMTPEPNGGVYVDEGLEAFIRKYGYDDISGIADRLNFGGRHFLDSRDSRTGLTLKLIGFDFQEKRIRNVDGMIALIDDDERIAASWNFAPMILHWNRKHNQACYVPSQNENLPIRKYRYGQNVLMGEGTDFHLFLSQIADKNIYYDPGIKLENASTNPKPKRRSQFRIKSKHLPGIYNNLQEVNILNS